MRGNVNMKMLENSREFSASRKSVGFSMTFILIGILVMFITAGCSLNKWNSQNPPPPAAAPANNPYVGQGCSVAGAENTEIVKQIPMKIRL